MSELFRIPSLVSPDLGADSESSNYTQIVAKLIFWPLALVTLAVLALQFDLWQQRYDFTGPFASDTYPPRYSLYLTVPQEGRLPWWRQSLAGDNFEKPFESRLKLAISGRSMGSPHARFGSIRSGKIGEYRHWNDLVIFALPPGVENNASTTVTISYGIEPRPWVTLVFLASSILLGWLLYRERLRRYVPTRDRIQWSAAIVSKAVYMMLFALCCLGLIGAAIFVVSSIYASMAGWALPTTALIRWWPLAAWAADNEPYLPYPLLTLAGLGALATWAASGFHQSHARLDPAEAWIQKLLSWAGFPIAASCFVFCLSAIWAGAVRPGDPNYANFGGLIAFNDAHGHIAAAFDQARDGDFDAFAMRRPFAAVFRLILLFFGQYSFPWMLLLQACLLGLAAWFASRAVMAWRGVWAGLAFFSLSYIYVRIFSTTSLTEPLGLFWALLSVPFFIDALRSGSERSALVGFTLTALALMTRMGNMLAIPALLIWLVWQFGQGVAGKARIALLSIGILLGVSGLNSLLQKEYGAGHGSTGSNFSYTLCGLTFGTTWDGCLKKLEATRALDAPPLSEDAVVAKMYAMAWKNFQDDPSVLFRRLGSAILQFTARFPQALLRGYGERIDEPRWFPRRTLILLVLAGLWFVARRQADMREKSFWALVWGSLNASAAIVYFDDGARVLAASQPLIALLLATGLTNPALNRRSAPSDLRLPLYGAAGLLIIALAFTTIPRISHRDFAVAMIPNPSPPKAGEVLAFGGKRMSGYLVVADDDPLTGDVPRIRLSDFEDIIDESGAEDFYQGLLHPLSPPLPFGFVFAPRMERGVSSDYLYIVPPQVVESRDISAWRFNIEPWQHKPDVTGNYWVHVTHATPLTAQAR
jgi:hypothetical protein